MGKLSVTPGNALLNCPLNDAKEIDFESSKLRELWAELSNIHHVSVLKRHKCEATQSM